jgi:hypothetical protein
MYACAMEYAHVIQDPSSQYTKILSSICLWKGCTILILTQCSLIPGISYSKIETASANQRELLS